MCRLCSVDVPDLQCAGYRVYRFYECLKNNTQWCRRAAWGAEQYGLEAGLRGQRAACSTAAVYGLTCAAARQERCFGRAGSPSVQHHGCAAAAEAPGASGGTAEASGAENLGSVEAGEAPSVSGSTGGTGSAEQCSPAVLRRGWSGEAGRAAGVPGEACRALQALRGTATRRHSRVEASEAVALLQALRSTSMRLRCHMRVTEAGLLQALRSTAAQLACRVEAREAGLPKALRAAAMQRHFCMAPKEAVGGPGGRETVLVEAWLRSHALAQVGASGAASLEGRAPAASAPERSSSASYWAAAAQASGAADDPGFEWDAPAPGARDCSGPSNASAAEAQASDAVAGEFEGSAPAAHAPGYSASAAFAAAEAQAGNAMGDEAMWHAPAACAPDHSASTDAGVAEAQASSAVIGSLEWDAPGASGARNKGPERDAPAASTSDHGGSPAQATAAQASGAREECSEWGGHAASSAREDSREGDAAEASDAVGGNPEWEGSAASDAINDGLEDWDDAAASDAMDCRLGWDAAVGGSPELRGARGARSAQVGAPPGAWDPELQRRLQSTARKRKRKWERLGVVEHLKPALLKLGLLQRPRGPPAPRAQAKRQHKLRSWLVTQLCDGARLWVSSCVAGLPRRMTALASSCGLHVRVVAGVCLLICRVRNAMRRRCAVLRSCACTGTRRSLVRVRLSR